VSMMRGLHDDLYLVVGMIDPQSKRATMRFHVHHCGSWVWIGVLVLMTGAGVSLWPDVRLREVGCVGYLRANGGRRHEHHAGHTVCHFCAAGRKPGRRAASSRGERGHPGAAFRCAASAVRVRGSGSPWSGRDRGERLSKRRSREHR